MNGTLLMFHRQLCLSDERASGFCQLDIRPITLEEDVTQPMLCVLDAPSETGLSDAYTASSSSVAKLLSKRQDGFVMPDFQPRSLHKAPNCSATIGNIGTDYCPLTSADFS